MIKEDITRRQFFLLSLRKTTLERKQRKHKNPGRKCFETFFSNLTNTQFVLVKSSLSIKVKDIPENAQEEFIKHITNDAPETNVTIKISD